MTRRMNLPATKRTIEPPLPDNIGKERFLHGIHGNLRPFKIVDEIKRLQYDNPEKAIYLQLLKFKDAQRTELRLGYYMKGKKPSVKGRWVWGQFATMIPARDFRDMIKEAQDKKWI